MNLYAKYALLLAAIVLFCSCSVLEKSSRHGFESGYYHLKPAKKIDEKVYVAVSDEKVAFYGLTGNQVNSKARMTIPILIADSLCNFSLVCIKKSLDIDITTVLFKYRPAIHGLPAQLTTDFNAALYTGWRHDTYRLQSKRDQVGNCRFEIINRGFDFGFFAGPGTTLISPFSTRNLITNEYNGMIIQFGLAGFIESNVASFGIATGFDHLLGRDRSIWIYDKKPWVGFIVGIALN